MPKAPAPWMVAQILCGAPDPLGKSLSGARIVSCNASIRSVSAGRVQRSFKSLRPSGQRRCGLLHLWRKPLDQPPPFLAPPLYENAPPRSRHPRKHRAAALRPRHELSGVLFDWFRSWDCFLSVATDQVLKAVESIDYRKDGRVWQTDGPDLKPCLAETKEPRAQA